MPGPRRRKGDTIADPYGLLKVMAGCREALICASTSVRPFGTAYHAISMVTTAIDSLAYFITGQRHYYDIGGSVPLGDQPSGSMWLTDRDKPPNEREPWP